MDILGVGPLELLFILLIALIVLGPTDMVKAGRTLGRLLRRVVSSPTWQAVQQTSRDFRHLPNKLMREAGLEEDIKELREIKGQVDDLRSIRPELKLDEVEQQIKGAQADLSAWTTPPADSPQPPASRSNEEAKPTDAGKSTEQQSKDAPDNKT